MFQSILWLGTLVSVYLFFIFMTPVKPPPPKTLPTLEQILAQQPKKDEAVKEKPAVKVVPKKSNYEEIMAMEVGPADIQRGKEVYLSQCIRCHNKDPNIKGPIGPEMVDAPFEIMKYKVATGRYPDPEHFPKGFVPKRKTKQMTKFPQYVKDVASLHAYVQSLKR